VLRRICGPKRGEVLGGWGILHNEELHNLYSSPHIFRMTKSRGMRWAEHVALMGAGKNASQILVGKRERNKSLGRPSPVGFPRISLSLH
jgi:hypothetical protein